MKDNIEVRSVLRKTYIWGPITFWFFTSFVTLCFLVPDKDQASYPFGQFFLLLLTYSVFFLLVGLIWYSRRELLFLTTSKLQYTNVRGKLLSEYSLSDIVDFEWSHKPIQAGTRHMYSMQLNNDYVIISLKDKTELTITREEFENFEDIRNYLYKYCIKNQIIHVRPLADRQ